MEFKQWLIDRAKEKTTWMGVFTLLATFGVAFTLDQQEAIFTAISGLIAAFFIAKKDKED
jgi:formate hydrogenlyase subunit 3/multisubunit Na+/H+ antiporter MnhD subunit